MATYDERTAGQLIHFLESLNRAAQAIHASRDLDQILITLFEEVRGLLDVTGISIWLLDEPTGELVCRQSASPGPQSIRGWRLAPGEGLASRALETRQTVLTRDALQETTHCTGPQERLALQIRSILSVPLCSATQQLGVLQAVDVTPNRFGAKEAILLETLAASAVTALENAKLYARMHQELHEREQIETELRESEARYRAIIEDQTDLICRSLPDGTLTFVNEAYCRYFNRPREALVGKNFIAFMPHEDRRRMETYYRTLTPASPTNTLEIHATTSGSHGRWQSWVNRGIFDRNGRLMEIQSVGRDITAQREAEARAQESQTRLQRLFEHTLDALALVNTTLAFVDANPATCVLTGYAREMLLQYSVADVIAPDSQHILKHEWQALLEQGERTGQITLQRADGEKLIVDYTAVANIAPGLHLITARDATQRKRLEEELIRSERLALVGHLAASVAHEINNPLQAVLGCLGLAQEALSQGRETDEYLQMAREEVRRISRIINNMSDLYRIPTTQIQRVNVNLVVEEVLELTRKQCRDNQVKIVWRPEKRLPELQAIRDRLKQVCLNLLLNAIAAMPEGGQLTIETQHTRDPEGVNLRFSDTGHGMPLEVQAQIFKPFFSTRQHGSGLGLTISRDIITQHGGNIEVTSQEDVGTTFTVWLPLDYTPKTSP